MARWCTGRSTSISNLPNDMRIQAPAGRKIVEQHPHCSHRIGGKEIKVFETSPRRPKDSVSDGFRKRTAKDHFCCVSGGRPLRCQGLASAVSRMNSPIWSSATPPATTQRPSGDHGPIHTGAPASAPNGRVSHALTCRPSGTENIMTDPGPPIASRVESGDQRV